MPINNTNYQYHQNINVKETFATLKQNYGNKYCSANKGNYNNAIYKVKRDNTILDIAWMTGKNYKDLAKKK